VATGGDVLATVGNNQITREMLDHLIATIPEDKRVPFLTPDGRKKLLEEVVSLMLFAEAAKAQGMDKEAAVRTRLDYAQREYLAGEYLRKRLAENPLVTENDLRTFYKDHIGEFKPPEEIKARHIVVKSEQEANKIMSRLKEGADFAELAAKHNVDPTAATGGRLESQDGREWLPKGTFEASFDHVLFRIGKGQIGGPVKTQFGWHILKVDDKRQPETRTFPQVRSMIRNRLEEQKKTEMQKKITDELKKSIPVTIK
jgi:peptidyl-prolyl cis-trans isomerase C